MKKSTEYKAANQHLQEATLAKQHQMAVTVVIGAVQAELESALSEVKKMHEAANSEQRDQDELIQSYYSYMKDWLTK